MSLKVYFFIFWFIWLVVTIYMLLNFGKQKKENSEIFDFKNAFKVMFLISAFGLLLLSVTKTTLWNIMYPEKYISLYQEKDKTIMNNLFDFMNSKLDEAYQDGSLTDDKYDDSITDLEEQKKTTLEAINLKWKQIFTRHVVHGNVRAVSHFVKISKKAQNFHIHCKVKRKRGLLCNL